MHNQRIVALVYSQPAIKALVKCTVTSITVLNCIRNLNQFSKQNHVSIARIPGHAGVHGNEMAHYVAKSGSKSTIHGPESFIPVTYASCVSTVKDWSTDRWKSMWNERKDCLKMNEWWWWYYPTPSEGWGRGGIPRRPNSRATPQGLDHRLRIEREEPKIDLRRDSEAGQSRRR